jgi:hypothetical protein
MAWIVLFVALMLILEHGAIARVEEQIFAWRRCARFRINYAVPARARRDRAAKTFVRVNRRAVSVCRLTYPAA